jgi:hypothetical protein
MSTPFAAALNQLNAATAVLCNAVAVFEDGAPEGVSVLWDRAGLTSGAGPLGMQADAPTLSTLTARLPDEPHGAVFTLGGESFRIVEHTPDGAGWSVCRCEVMS